MGDDLKEFLGDLLRNVPSMRLNYLLDFAVEEERYEHAGLIKAEVERRLAAGLVEVDGDGRVLCSVPLEWEGVGGTVRPVGRKKKEEADDDGA